MGFIITLFGELPELDPDGGGKAEGKDGEIDEENAGVGGGEGKEETGELTEEVHKPEMEGKQEVGELAEKGG